MLKVLALACTLLFPSAIRAQVCSAGAANLTRSDLIPVQSLILPDLIANTVLILNHASQLFGVAPEFHFYDDQGEGNAFACRPTRPGDRGQVAIGLTLYLESYKQLIIRQRVRPGATTNAITAVLLHEFAHVSQAMYGLALPSWDLTSTELQADFLAGWALGLYAGYTASDVAGLLEAATQLHSMGDYEYNNPTHHGTPCQRRDAFKQGVAEGRRRVPLMLAAAASREIIEELRDDPPSCED